MEQLENLSITRQFHVSRDHINNALNWLIANNPLHADVTNMTYSRDLDINQFMSHQPFEENIVEEIHISPYICVNNNNISQLI